MAADKRTTVRLSEKLLRRARKTLNASTNEAAVTKALHESLINREIHATLKDLIRKGRGRFLEPVVSVGALINEGAIVTGVTPSASSG